MAKNKQKVRYYYRWPFRIPARIKRSPLVTKVRKFIEAKTTPKYFLVWYDHGDSYVVRPWFLWAWNKLWSDINKRQYVGS